MPDGKQEAEWGQAFSRAFFSSHLLGYKAQPSPQSWRWVLGAVVAEDFTVGLAITGWPGRGQGAETAGIWGATAQQHEHP